MKQRVYISRSGKHKSLAACLYNKNERKKKKNKKKKRKKKVTGHAYVNYFCYQSCSYTKDFLRYFSKLLGMSFKKNVIKTFCVGYISSLWSKITRTRILRCTDHRIFPFFFFFFFYVSNTVRLFFVTRYTSANYAVACICEQKKKKIWKKNYNKKRSRVYKRRNGHFARE